MGDPALTRWHRIVRWWYRHETPVLQVVIVACVLGMIAIPYKAEIKRFMAALLLAVLGGCGYSLPFVKEPGNFACVRVVWTEDIQNHCAPNARGCATVRNGHNVGTIWARKPKAFDDHEAVCTIGHEFLHSLDATHP